MNEANKALLRTPHKVRRPENADVVLIYIEKTNGQS